jgi:hypothetical protein
MSEDVLDSCGCCEPGVRHTPAQVSNTPGRPAVQRRVGTASSFAATMAADLTAQAALADFTNRRADDPAIALVDAWSVALDVLTFYSERLSNEGYLRTAVEPRSLVELAHSVGYTPGRGRAAATLLAFTLQDAEGAPALVPIPPGTKVASLPGPGQVPQNYETTEAVQARPEWNAIQARSRMSQRLAVGATSALVQGARADLAVGDAVLLVGSEREADGASQHWAFRLLSGVRLIAGANADANVTELSWSEPLGSPAADTGRVGAERVPDPRDARLYVLRRKAGVFGAAAPDFRLIHASVTAAAGSAEGATTFADGGEVAAAPAPSGPSISVQVQSIVAAPGPDWPGWTVRAPGQPENTIDLDAVYPSAGPGSWAVLTRSGITGCYRILGVGEQSRTDYTLNGKVSRITTAGPPVSSLFSDRVRQTSAWVGSELLPLATSPVMLPSQGDRVDLATPVPTLEAGRRLVVSGPRPVIRVGEGVRHLVLHREGQPNVSLHPGDELEVVGPVTENTNGSLTWPTVAGTVTADPPEVLKVARAQDATSYSEVVVVAEPTPDQPEVDAIRLSTMLVGCYDADAVRIFANVAPATHGETRAVVLGSGDSATPYQQFHLAQRPLTYVAAKSGGAVVSTLEIRVDGQAWTEVPQLFGCGPADEVYTTSSDDIGAVTVQFGDGVTGARLPTGTNNVAARYRIGTGLDGRVAADQLTLLMTRPLGVRSVSNPLPAGLAADPEPPDAVRSNAARTALTLDRVVSLRDVEDFARSVPGIDKAQAVWLWDGRMRFVHLTVAGVGAQEVDPQAITDLESSVRSVGDARLPLLIAPAEVVSVAVSATVVVDPAYESDPVLDAVAAAITSALTVEARALGQPLSSGDIILAAHQVTGTAGVSVALPPSDVSSFRARMVGSTPMPAQLVVLAQGQLSVTEAVS